MSDPTKARDPSPAAADDSDIVLGRMAEAIREVVGLIGPAAVQRAFATASGEATPGRLDADRLGSGDDAQGDVARRAVKIALDMMAPAIGERAAADLSHYVSRLGDGSKLPNVLTAAAASHVRWDPMSRAGAIMLVRIAARVAFRQFAFGNADDQSKATGYLAQIGLFDPGGYVAVEHAILKKSGAALSSDAWERAKQSLTPFQCDVTELVIRIALDTPDESDAQLLAGTAKVKDVTDAFLRAADIARGGDLHAHIKHVWWAGTTRGIPPKQRGRKQRG